MFDSKKFGRPKESIPSPEQAKLDLGSLVNTAIQYVKAKDPGNRSVETPPGGGNPLNAEDLSKKIEGGTDVKAPTASAPTSDADVQKTSSKDELAELKARTLRNNEPRSEASPVDESNGDSKT